MIKHKNLVIIGTSHISEESINKITSVFIKENPDIVAVELDPQRLQALLSGQKPNYSPKIIPRIGFKGYLFALIGGLIQQKLGSIVGVKPGSDMLKAVELARDNKKRLALIDRDVQATLSSLSRSITWKEKMNFLLDIISAPFAKKTRINLKQVPGDELIKKLLGVLKKRYPGAYKALVEERNKIMSLKLKALMDNYPDKKILAVIGAGHESGLISLVKASEKRNLYKPSSPKQL